MRGKTGRLVVSLIFALLLWSVVFLRQGTTKRNNALDASSPPEITGIPSSTRSGQAVTQAPEAETDSPPEFATMRIAVAGDLVVHDAIHDEARTADGFDFNPMMASLRPVAERADIAVLCLEAALMESGFSGYPMFKSPDELAEAIAATGFDLVSTASNHALDGLGHGLVRTLDVLDENGLAHVGTFRTFDEWAKNRGITVLERNGISVAFLAYTYGTNAINVDTVGGHSRSVSLFIKDYLTLTNYDVDYDRMRSDMAAARALGTDLIAVFMHWGIEYKTTPDSIQTAAADFLITEGADLILGGHPHVPQPLELRKVPDGNGGERNVFLNYCMGNLISSMNDMNTKLTGVAEIDIKKNLQTGETTVEKASYVPYYMADLGDFGVYSPDWRYRLIDLHLEIDAYEELIANGEDTAPYNDGIYRDMLVSLEGLHRIFGREYDSYYK